ncbi:hypothetical protein CPB97_009441 [Podila verticillata]|nr:hypothetical protein CPB97_009441 [Podila verticillata]
MGNVSSADHEKVNELLTKRALKKAHKKQLQQQRQQQQQQQQQQQLQQDVHRHVAIQTYSYYDDYHPVATPSKSPERPFFNSNNTDNLNTNPQPNLSQADFYSHSSNGYAPNGQPKNIMDFFPVSPSSTSTATSDNAFLGSRDEPDIHRHGSI